MSEDARRPEYIPLNLHPLVGLDLGERWGREVGELSQRLTGVEQAVDRLGLKTDVLDAKVSEIAQILVRHDERFGHVDDKFASLEKRLDERFGYVDERFNHVDDKFASLEKKLDHNAKLLWGMFTAMLAAIIVQKFI